jgi:hypothetical protein
MPQTPSTPKTRSPAHTETTEMLAAFEQWYASDRRSTVAIQATGVKSATFYSWMEKWRWHERADQRDAVAKAQADKLASARTAKVLADQLKAGELLRLRGTEFFRTNTIKQGHVALGAIKTGVDMERQAVGLPDYVTSILNANPAALDEYIDAMDARRRACLPDSDSTPERD